MARIIVQAEANGDGEGAVLLRERVLPDHVSTDHSVTQLIERLRWAIDDATAVEANPRVEE